VVSHLVGGGLLASLLYRGHTPRALLPIWALIELLTLLLWIFVDNSWVGIVALFVVLQVYERRVGPRLSVQKNAVFKADKHFLQLFKEAFSGEYPVVAGSEGETYILTDLQYIVYAEIQYGKPPGKQVVSNLEMAAVEEGFDPHLEKLITSIPTKNKSFFHVTLANDMTVTYMCPSRKLTDTWQGLLRTSLGDTVQHYHDKWLHNLLCDVSISDVNNSAISIETALSVLSKAGRPLDKAYGKELFQTAAKSAKNKDQNTLSPEDFSTFFDQATSVPDIKELYDSLLGTESKDVILNTLKLREFLLETQKENVTKEVTRQWIRKFETFLPFYSFSNTGFTTFLLSDEHSILNRQCQTVYQDMTQPLSHYFISTSHNTYLTKDQLKGKSSVDAYISALKRGCKCVELDIWDGPNNEPIIYHGHTLTSKILFKDVVAAIGEYAFIVSDYPVILSFENHCTLDQQRVMATYLVNLLGDKLYTHPIPDNETQLPSPDDLKGYIIVKSRKLKQGTEEVEVADEDLPSGDEDDDIEEDEETSVTTAVTEVVNGDVNANGDIGEEETNTEDAEDAKLDVNGETETPNEDAKTEISSEGNEEEKTGEDVKEEQKNGKTKPPLKRKSSFRGSLSLKGKISFRKKKPKSAKMAQELSDLVQYCQAVTFKGFKHAKENYKHYEMSSFGEKKAMRLCREEAVKLLTYSRRQLCRIYPAGSRVDSSNYDPLPLWAAGCQLVALNFQTPDRPMQLNQGLFQDNGGCGYVLKPEFMRTDNSLFDPRGPYNKVKQLTVRVISGIQLPYTSENKVKSERSLQVHIRLHGVEPDCVKEKTKTVKNNGFYAVWDDFVSFRVHVESLAMLSFTLKEGDAFVGQFTLPVRCMRMGYRRVPLMTKAFDQSTCGCLFVHSKLEEFTN